MPTARGSNQPAVEQVAVKRIGRDEGRWIVVSVSELRIVFLGSAAIARRVAFPDLEPAAFRPSRVYVRTGGGVYVTCFRSVSACMAVLGRDGWVLCFKSIGMNVHHLAWIEDRGTQRIAAVRVGINNGTECVPVSRRHLRAILSRLGVCLRRRGSSEHDEME
jgi:hypothetical protein